jgi:drug/metabolite transporter (DMT)-like permease
MWIFFIVAMVLVDVLYTSTAKYWSQHVEKWYLPLIAFIFLIGTNIFFLFALKSGSGLARGTTYFGVLSSILTILIAWFFFKETFTYAQWAGVTLGVLALYLLH